MIPRRIAFFNSSAGVGTTSAVYHVAWMAAARGRSVLAVDLDPQCHLTARLLTEDQRENLIQPAGAASSVLRRLRAGARVGGEATLLDIADRLWLLPGDLALAGLEPELGGPGAGGEARWDAAAAVGQLMADAARRAGADIVLVDVGPTLGAISRVVLSAADHIVSTVTATLDGVRGMATAGEAVRSWSGRSAGPDRPGDGGRGAMRPMGYLLLGSGLVSGQTIDSYQRWLGRIPQMFRTSVLGVDEPAPPLPADPYCLGETRRLRGLLPLAHEARKPVFALKPADGAFGGHQPAVVAAAAEFATLTERILTEAARPGPEGHTIGGAAA